jgi:hypothetical protein
MSIVDWLLRIADGENFKRSSIFHIWGIQTTTSPHGKYFVKEVKPGDHLWFVTSNSHGKIIAMATYKSHNKREFGPLVDISMTNVELGWTKPRDVEQDWDIEVHYSDLYNLEDCELYSRIRCPTVIRKYDEKCKVKLADEYINIKRYLKTQKSML